MNEELIKRIDSQISFCEHTGNLTGINVLLDCRAALSQSEPVRYVQMTQDERLNAIEECLGANEDEFAENLESMVIRRAIAQGAKLEVQE